MKIDDFDYLNDLFEVRTKNKSIDKMREINNILAPLLNKKVSNNIADDSDIGDLIDNL